MIRGIQIGRGLVDKTFKTRSYWTALIASFFITTTLLNFVPFFGAPQTTFVGAFLGSLPWQVEFFILFSFIDSTIMVTMKMDFFHRNTLRWSSFRRPLTVAYVVSDFFLFTSTNYAYSGGPPGWLVPIVYASVAVVIGPLLIGVPILLIGARRTPDRTMKRFVTLLGLTMLLYVLFGLVLGEISPSVSQATSILGPVAAFVFYKAVMSLSPVGRIESSFTTSSLPSVKGARLPLQSRRQRTLVSLFGSRSNRSVIH